MLLKFKYDIREVKLWAMTVYENKYTVPDHFKNDFLAEFSLNKSNIQIILEENLQNYLDEAHKILDEFMKNLYHCSRNDEFENLNFEAQNRIERQKLLEWRSSPFEITTKTAKQGNIASGQNLLG